MSVEHPAEDAANQEAEALEQPSKLEKHISPEFRPKDGKEEADRDTGIETAKQEIFSLFRQPDQSMPRVIQENGPEARQTTGHRKRGILERIKNIFRSKEKILELKAESDMKEAVRRYGMKHLPYGIGEGIASMACGEGGILSERFLDCSAIVFQTRDAVAMLHISPNTIKEDYEKDYMPMRDSDYAGHITEMLREILGEISPGETLCGGKGTTEPLNNEEIAKLKELIESGTLTAKIVSSDDNLEHALKLALSSGPRRAIEGRGGTYFKLPAFRPQAYNMKEGRRDIYATPRDLFVIVNGKKVLEEGVNFPLKLIE